MSICLCLLPDYKLRVTNYHHVFLSLMECGLKVWDQRSHSSSELLFATRCTSNQSEPLLRSILLIKKKKKKTLEEYWKLNERKRWWFPGVTMFLILELIPFQCLLGLFQLCFPLFTLSACLEEWRTRWERVLPVSDWVLEREDGRRASESSP